MEKYFIIRTCSWPICSVCGTMQQLEKLLASFGSKIVDTQEIYYEDLCLVYRQRIMTETDILGFNEIMYEALEDEVYDKLSYWSVSHKLNHPNVEVPYYHRKDIKQPLFNICNNLSDKLDILVSDGEEYKVPLKHRNFRRTFRRFSNKLAKNAVVDARGFARSYAFFQMMHLFDPTKDIQKCTK